MITTDQYKLIVCIFDFKHSLLNDSNNELVDMQNILTNSLVDDGDLRDSIEFTRNDILTDIETSSTSERELLRSLQQLTQSDHGDINAFLTNNSILVSQTFADRSSEVGFPIDPINIGESCM